MSSEIFDLYKNHLETQTNLSNHDGSSNPLLCGVLSKKSPPTIPHRFDHDMQERHQERMTFSGNMGRVVEDCIFKVWSEEIKSDKSIKDEISNILDNYVPKTKNFYTSETKQNRPEHQEISDFFSIMFTAVDEIDENFIPILKPEDEKLNTLINIVEKEYGISGSLSGYYERIIVSGQTKEEIRYFAETLFIISKELIKPTLTTQNGLIIPNVRIENGNLIGQFDGVYMPKPPINTPSDFKFWKHTQHRRWVPIETKVPFRARYLTDKRWINAPFTRDIAQTQERLGKIIVEAFKTGKNFRPPEYIIFAYLRGVLPNVVHNLRIDSFFIGCWANGIEERLRNLSSSYPKDKVDDAKILFYKLNELHNNLLKREKQKKKPIGPIQGKQSSFGLEEKNVSKIENEDIRNWVETHKTEAPKRKNKKHTKQASLF